MFSLFLLFTFLWIKLSLIGLKTNALMCCVVCYAAQSQNSLKSSKLMHKFTHILMQKFTHMFTQNLRLMQKFMQKITHKYMQNFMHKLAHKIMQKLTYKFMHSLRQSLRKIRLSKSLRKS